MYFFLLGLREATKKNIFLMAVELRGGGEEGKGLAFKKKKYFLDFFLFRQKILLPLALPRRKCYFFIFAASLIFYFFFFL